MRSHGRLRTGRRRRALGALGLALSLAGPACQSSGLRSSKNLAKADCQPAPPPPDSLALAAQGGSLEAQLSELLRLWLEAQNRRDLALLGRLYLPCYGGATAESTGPIPGWMREHYLIADKRQRVLVEDQAPEFLWPDASWGRPREPELRVTVRRKNGDEQSIVMVFLRLAWPIDDPKQRPRIASERDVWLSDWSGDDEGPPLPKRQPLPKVTTSCGQCPPPSSVPSSALISDCKRKCESASSELQRAACELLARSYLLGECGQPKDRETGLSYTAKVGRALSSDVVERLLERGEPGDIETAQSAMACTPREGELFPADCADRALAYQLLWATGKSEWRQAALAALTPRCIATLDGQDCPDSNWQCDTLVELLESKDADESQRKLAKEYRQRAQGAAKRCSNLYDND